MGTPYQRATCPQAILGETSHSETREATGGRGRRGWRKEGMKGGAAGRRRPRNPTADPQAPAAGGRALRAAASRPRRAGGACRRAERGAAAAAEATATAATDRVGGWAALPGARVRMGAPPRRRPRPTAAAQNGGGRGSGGGGKKVMAATRRLSSPVHPSTHAAEAGDDAWQPEARRPHEPDQQPSLSAAAAEKGGGHGQVWQWCARFISLSWQVPLGASRHVFCATVYTNLSSIRV